MSSSPVKGRQSQTKTKEFDLPITSQNISSVAYISAIFLNVATAVFLAVVSRYDILFSSTDPKDIRKTLTISNEPRTIYAAAITLLATLVSAFSVGQIKQLWLKRIDTLSSIGRYTKLRKNNATLIGLSSVSEKFGVWEVSLVLVISGLSTTAMVAGLNPTLVVRKYQSPKYPTLTFNKSRY